jgi:hypothetical protein
MASTRTIILSDPIIDAVCDALELDKHVTNRIVLRLQVGEPILAEVTMFGTDTFLEQDWGEVIQEAQQQG